MNSLFDSPPPVLVVGSGNGETVLSLEEDLLLDRKYEVDSYELFGGSGVNYTLRLLNAKTPVFPVLPLGADDLGVRIRNEILASAYRAQAPEPILRYIESSRFLNDFLKTQRAVILVEGSRRTIFADKLHSGAQFFRQQLENSIAYFKERVASENAAVMIGHIHSDHPRCCAVRPGESARHIIDTFWRDNAVFCNFGAGQTCMGADYWDEHLKKVKLFQLNLREIKSFFSTGSSVPCLADILDWFKRRNITLVVTLDKFGSIASYKDGRDGVIVSWPREFPGFLDPTGAGDAFFAGLVHELRRAPDFSFSEFYNAIETATVWATYACGHFGGSSNCPAPETLEEFKSERYFNERDSQLLTIKEADLILRVFDRMTNIPKRSAKSEKEKQRD